MNERRFFLRGLAATASLISIAPSIDFGLLSQVAELHAVEAWQSEATHGRQEDCEDIPGYIESEVRRSALLHAIASTPAATMEGIKAKASLLQLPGIAGGFEDVMAIGQSIARDVLAWEGGR